jgi:hypothetical protein
VSTGVADTVAREAAGRRPAGIAALLGGIFLFAGGLLFQLIVGRGPGIEEQVGVLDALDSRLDGRPVETGLAVQQVDYFGDNVPLLLLSTLLTAASIALASYALVFLYQAIRARQDTVGRGGLIAIVTGGVMFPVGHLVSRGAAFLSAAGFEDAEDRTSQAARDALASPTVVAGQLIETIGLFAFGLGLALAALNAMRAGLLTRFMGVLGIVVAAFAIIQIDQPPFVRALWFVFLGFLLLRLGPFKTPPPAWESGTAVPWPSQQQLREAKAEAAGERGSRGRGGKPAAAGATDGDGDPGGGRPVPAGAVRAGGQRRKRKRRG